MTGREAGLGTITTGAAVSLLALTAAAVQPRAGRALDDGRVTSRTGLTIGLTVTAAGLLAAILPGLAGLLVAAVLVGAGTGLITPLGFAAPATNTPAERLGQTMGAAELGREAGDAGGVGTALTLTYGFGALAVVVAAIGLALARTPGGKAS